MVIGFTERRRTVSESMALPGFDFFPLPIDVATLRTAEREHPMIFRLQMSSSSAIVEPPGTGNIFVDALFGSRDDTDGPIDVFLVLDALDDVIRSRTAFIRNEFYIEETECFTIRIFPVDVPGRHELFLCNKDDVGATNYFCQTTICIEDDDGEHFNSVFLVMWVVLITRTICCGLCGDNVHC